MARVNVEEKWWSDPRRTMLGQLLGNPYLTEGVATMAWRLSQEYWEKRQLIPGHIFITLHGAFELLTTNLACLHENQDPESSKLPTPIQHIASTDPTGIQHMRTHTNEIQEAYVYVRGAREYLSWGADLRHKRIEAGKKSAQRERDERGRLLPKSTETQQITNTPPANSNTLQLSGSGSGSGSVSSSISKKKNNAGIRTDYPQSFEELWKAYERKGDKKKSYEEYQALRLTQEEIVTLTLAISAYKQANSEPKFRKDFERYLKTDWREHLNLPAATETDWAKICGVTPDDSH